MGVEDSSSHIVIDCGGHIRLLVVGVGVGEVVDGPSCVVADVLKIKCKNRVRRQKI